MATKVRVLGARSSLRNHEFPLFYACYLLKSLALPLSRRATYIGSTPDPPRRLKQHNGQLPAGARRTVSQRPWEMQMVVHGFPSKMAALQFEWAWQHPHKSRHFCEQTGRIFGTRGTKCIEKVIKIVRTMITRPPFNNWPLHVKLFTGEAVKLWNAVSAQKHAPATPPGFTCSIELEGVDGNSGHPGSGRKGAIAVKDLDFTNAHLAKHISLLATQKPLECSICLKPVHNYTTEPLETSLCPSLHCTAVSHLSCLSQHFLASEGADKRNQNKSQLIPRGANCKTCNNYILWGDVIRGSYRRFRAMQKTQDGADDAVDEDDLFVSDEDGTPIKAKKKKSSGKQPRRRSTSRSSRRKSVDEKTKSVSSSSSGESFDFDNISSDSESEPSTVRRTGRAPKSKVVSLLVSPGPSKRAPKVKANNVEPVRRAPRKGVSTMLDSSNSEAEGNTKRKPGRPKGSRNTPSPGMLASPPGSSLKNKGKAKATIPQETFTMDDLRAALAIISNNRMNLGSHLVSETKKQSSRRKKSPASQTSASIAEAPAKRKPGRPRKTSSSDVSARGTSRDASPMVISSNPTKPATITRSRGRPRSEVSLSSSNSDSSLDTPTRKRGRPRKTDSASSSSNDITIISHKRKPGRPRKEQGPVSPSTVRKRVVPQKGFASDKRARDSASSSSNDISIIPNKRKPGRPRKEKDPISPSTVNNGVCPKKDLPNSGLVKRKPGRPRKEKDPESPPPLSNRVPIKQKADRTSGLMPSTFLTKAQFSTVSSSKMGMHTQSVQNDSSSGESFDFTGLSDSDSDEDFKRYLARRG